MYGLLPAGHHAHVVQCRTMMYYLVVSMVNYWYLVKIYWWLTVNWVDEGNLQIRVNTNIRTKMGFTFIISHINKFRFPLGPDKNCM